MNPKDVKNLIQDAGGKVEEAFLLPDGHCFMTASFPLPKDHWSCVNPDEHNVPPMPFRIGEDHPDRKRWEDGIRDACRYAYRCSTMNGKDEDIDPDALVKNIIVGLIGYHTADGLGSVTGYNPDPIPPTFPGRLPEGEGV